MGRQSGRLLAAPALPGFARRRFEGSTFTGITGEPLGDPGLEATFQTVGLDSCLPQ